MSVQDQRRMSGVAGALALAVLLLACSPATRYKVLNFFFDGVPDPHAKKAGAAGMEHPPSLFHPLAAPLTEPKPTPLPIVSRHKPFAAGQCKACHEGERGFEPIAVNAQLCDRCHKEQRQREGWNHGPVNLGTCIPCHLAHESPYPRLLDKPVPELCLTCHKEDLEKNKKYHQAPNIKECTACHDPHRMY